ncbi:ADP-ribosylation factor 2-B [Artemisia annua]|uniref:ADP-ribosylation factor 2-B n=1 Tax=Artemisia annua TaxID=35608 RepID=A0A2U1KJD5_ARTAN|nr:ADP-ribosylation factor 2-B [Artemisia annua]
MEDANTDRHLEAVASYADFRGSMEEKQAELQTAFTSSDEKTLTNLQQEFKDDPILVSKLLEFMDSHKATSKALSSLPDLFKGTQQASVLTTLQAQESKITQLSSGHIQSTCATSGEGLYEGLDWLSNSIANKDNQYLADFAAKDAQ